MSCKQCGSVDAPVETMLCTVCSRAFYNAAVRLHESDDLEIDNSLSDPDTITAGADDGAWVTARVWIPADELQPSDHEPEDGCA